jgi:arylformamidase
MEIFDISVPIRPGMITYPGDPEVHVERVVSIEHGDVANLTRLDFGVHTGTHVDAPVHFIDGGTAADALPLDVFLGPCEVVDATAANDEVGPELVPSHVERVLFKTRNSELCERDSFDEGFTRIGLAAGQRLVENGVRLVGVDYSRSAIRRHTRPCLGPASQRSRAST